MIKSLAAWFLLTIVFTAGVKAQDTLPAYKPVSPLKVFHHMGRNALGSVTFKYGIPYATACLSTYAMVKGGLDWKWYRFSEGTGWMRGAGYPGFYAQSALGLSVPIGVYLAGLLYKNTDLQTTGLAMTQAVSLAVAITVTGKIFTGRAGPYELTNMTDYSTNWKFGLFRGGVNDGWPSGHTAGAVAIATTLIRLYPHNLPIAIGSLAYATFVGLSVSTNVHWASDVVAGALIGWAIGEVVGRSFKKLMAPKPGKGTFSLAPTGTGLALKF